MKSIFFSIFALLTVAIIAGCEPETPEPEGQAASFIIDGQTVDGFVVAFRQPTEFLGENHLITFSSEAYTLNFTLFESGVGPLTTGKVLTYEDDGNPKTEVALAFRKEDGTTSPEEVHNLLSGTITIEEYDQTAPSISLAFDLEMIKTIDLSSTLSLSGALTEVPIEEE